VWRCTRQNKRRFYVRQRDTFLLLGADEQGHCSYNDYCKCVKLLGMLGETGLNDVTRIERMEKRLKKTDLKPEVN
jgi:hypothetical protein